MYLAWGEYTRASTGRWVLMKRRCVWASTAASLISLGGTRKSIHGDIACVSISVSPLNSICEMICCIQVVPDFAYVEMMMSSSLNLKSFQNVESMCWLCISFVFSGHATAMLILNLRFLARALACFPDCCSN